MANYMAVPGSCRLGTVHDMTLCTASAFPRLGPFLSDVDATKIQVPRFRSNHLNRKAGMRAHPSPRSTRADNG